MLVGAGVVKHAGDGIEGVGGNGNARRGGGGAVVVHEGEEGGGVGGGGEGRGCSDERREPGRGGEARAGGETGPEGGGIELEVGGVGVMLGPLEHGGGERTGAERVAE